MINDQTTYYIIVNNVYHENTRAEIPFQSQFLTWPQFFLFCQCCDAVPYHMTIRQQLQLDQAQKFMVRPFFNDIFVDSPLFKLCVAHFIYQILAQLLMRIFVGINSQGFLSLLKEVTCLQMVMKPLNAALQNEFFKPISFLFTKSN